MKIPEFLRKRGIKTILCLDWETYFDVEYTLKKLSTSEYIRDKRFKAHGIGLQKHNAKTQRWVSDEKITEALKKIDWSTTAILAHHTQFDGLILTHHFGHIPAYYLDTLSMARVWINHTVGNSLNDVAYYYHLGNKLPDILDQTKGIRDLPTSLLKQLGDYCKQDVNLTLQILELMINEGFPEKELDLIDLTVRMFTEPKLTVNKKLAASELERIIQSNLKVLRSTAQYFHLPRALSSDERIEQARLILRSDIKLAAAIEKLGYTVPMKTTKAGNIKPAFAKTDLEFQELQMHPDKRIRNICAARLIAKSTVEESKASRLLSHCNPRLPIYLNYGRAHTYRWTGGDNFNPQNFPREGKLRNCIIAPRGYKLVIVDSSQIEARVVAWLAGQADLLAAFADPKRDPYCELAEAIFGHKVTKKMFKDRFVGKVGTLGLGFGMGWFRYRYTLANGSMGATVIVDEEVAKEAVRVYRQKNDKIIKLWGYMGARIREMSRETVQERKTLQGILTFNHEAVTLPNGLTLHYPKVKGVPRNQVDNTINGYEYWNGHKYTKIYGGLFTENVTQAVARIIVAEQMLPIAEQYRIVMMTHDEAVYLAPTRQAQKALDMGLDSFSTSQGWYADIPLAAEGKHAFEYTK